ncbi:MAG: hypothetical protein Q8M65_04325 [Rhodoglobus sp.]|nr:hypothetical protein [Rhodoglobus sp.]
MRWLRRTPRFSLGRYVGPLEMRQASIDEMVDDGVLIAAAATRIAIKNLVILKAMRDRVDYSIERTTSDVRQELNNLGAEKDHDAARLTNESARAALRAGDAEGHSDYRHADAFALERRAEVSRRLADRLRELSRDDEFVGKLVEASHAAAWAEIADSIASRAELSSVSSHDANYARERGDRLIGLLGDLNDLDNRPR